MMKSSSSRRADDQAMSVFGPVTAFVGVAAVTAAIIVASTVKSSAQYDQVVGTATVPAEGVTFEPQPPSLTPAQVNQIMQVNSLVATSAGIAVPAVSLPLKATYSSRAGAPAKVVKPNRSTLGATPARRATSAVPATPATPATASAPATPATPALPATPAKHAKPTHPAKALEQVAKAAAKAQKNAAKALKNAEKAAAKVQKKAEKAAAKAQKKAEKAAAKAQKKAQKKAGRA